MPGGERNGMAGAAPGHLPLRKRLSYKQARNTVLLTLLLGLVLTGVQVFADLLQLRRNTDSLAHQILRTVQDPAAEAAYAFDKGLASRMVDGLFEYRPIVEAEILDDFGSALARRERPPATSGLTWLAETLLPEKRRYAIPLMIERNRQIVGELRIAVDRTLIATEFFDRSALVLGAGVLWTIGLAVILVVMFYLSVTQPFLRLTRDVARVDPARPAEGLLTIPRVHAEDELGLLARTINGLLLQLGDSLERQQADEDRLREREGRLRDIMENVADGIVTLDQQMRVETMNRAALTLFGFEPGEVSGMPFDRCIAESDLRRFLVALARSLDRTGSDRVVRQELTGRRKSGNTVPIAFSVSRMRAGEHTTFICVVQDITERKRAEAALRESEERLKLAVTATRSGIWWDAAGFDETAGCGKLTATGGLRDERRTGS